jgi:hypothetical protein
MPWPPPVNATTGLAVQGVTTIRWGTDGLLQSPKPSVGYYTVLRFNQRPLVDSQKLPNGSGVTTTRVMVIDGVEFDITVRDDTRMTPPAPGGVVSIVDAGGLLGTVGLVYTATVIDPAYEVSPKQAGERTIHAENLVLIESQSGAAQV